MKVSAQYAEAQFPDVFHAAQNGEEIVIERSGMPSLILVPKPEPELPTVPRIPRRELLGSLEGLVRVPGVEEWNLIDQDVSPQVEWHTAPRPRSELLGSLKGKIHLAPDWDSDETNNEIAEQFEGTAREPEPIAQ